MARVPAGATAFTHRHAAYVLNIIARSPDREGEDDHGPWTEEDPDREMRIALAVPIAQLLDE